MQRFAVVSVLSCVVMSSMQCTSELDYQAVAVTASALQAACGPSAGVAVTQVVAQARQSCAILADTKKLACWGYATDISSWPHDIPVRSVATGELSSCATRADNGSLLCWGWVPPLPSPGDFTKLSVAANQAAVCALRTLDGGAQCWSSAGELTGVPDAGPYNDIAISETVACAIRAEDETMRCWNLVGTGEPAIHAPPGGFKALVAHSNFFCAIRTDTNEAVCWGPQPPADPPAGVAFESFGVTSDGAGCGLRADNHTLQCWNTSALLLQGAPLGIPLSALAVADAHACAVRADNHEVTCWGDDSWGNVSGVPSRVAYDQVVSDAADFASYRRICARRTDNGRVVCSGSGTGPKLPSDVSFTQITPWCGIRANNGHLLCVGGTADVTPPDIAFTQIDQRDGMVCGIRADNGATLCFGSDSERIVSDVPHDVAFRQISVGATQACGLRSDDSHPVCWGTGATSPAPAISLSQITTTRHINGDTDLTCGVRSDDSHVVCWGTGQNYLPTDVAFTRLSEEASCAIRADNHRALCWFGYGYNSPDWRTFREVSATYDGACGISDHDGRLTCWGLTFWDME